MCSRVQHLHAHAVKEITRKQHYHRLPMRLADRNRHLAQRGASRSLVARRVRASLKQTTLSCQTVNASSPDVDNRVVCNACGRMRVLQSTHGARAKKEEQMVQN